MKRGRLDFVSTRQATKESKLSSPGVIATSSVFSPTFDTTGQAKTDRITLRWGSDIQIIRPSFLDQDWRQQLQSEC